MHPVLVQWGVCRLTGFFALAVFAAAVAAFLAARRGRQAGLQPKQIVVLEAAALFSMVAGSRLGYVLIHAGYYRIHLGGIFRIDSGGLALAGGFLLTCLTVPLLLRRFGRPVLADIDWMIPPLVLGQAIMKVGCFLQGCCYGRLTRLPWGITYPSEAVRRHPTQLLESAALFLLFFLLLRLERNQRWAGTNLLWYGFLYGSYRFAADFLRADSVPLAAGLKLSQWMALPLVLLCGVLLIRHRRRCTRSS